MVREKALLIFIDFIWDIHKKPKISSGKYSINENIEELSNLALSAGAEIVDLLSCRQQKPNSKYFISTGRLENLNTLISEKKVEIVIFDDEVAVFFCLCQLTIAVDGKLCFWTKKGSCWKVDVCFLNRFSKLIDSDISRSEFLRIYLNPDCVGSAKCLHLGHSIDNIQSLTNERMGIGV